MQSDVIAKSDISGKEGKLEKNPMYRIYSCMMCVIKVIDDAIIVLSRHSPSGPHCCNN